MDISGAKYCQYYVDGGGNTNKAKCSFLNKAGWCYYKRRCLSDEEKNKERYCVNFRKQGVSKKNIKKKRK